MDSIPTRTYARPMTGGLDAERDAFAEQVFGSMLGSFE